MVANLRRQFFMVRMVPKLSKLSSLRGDGEMKRALLAICTLMLVTGSCSHKSKPQPASLQPTASGTAIVESSGGKQIGYIGMPLDQPVVVQVNGASGRAVAGVAVYLSGPAGVTFLADHRSSSMEFFRSSIYYAVNSCTRSTDVQ